MWIAPRGVQLLPNRVTASVSSIGAVHQVNADAAIYKSSYEDKGDLHPSYLLRVEIKWNQRSVKFTHWDDDPLDFNEVAVRKAWSVTVWGLSFQSGGSISRLFKEQAKRDENINLDVPVAVESLFAAVLEKLKEAIQVALPLTSAAAEVTEPASEEAPPPN